jgi:hypothetical protein
VYSLYITSRTEDVSRFCGMSWRSSHKQAPTPANEYHPGNRRIKNDSDCVYVPHGESVLLLFELIEY